MFGVYILLTPRSNGNKKIEPKSLTGSKQFPITAVEHLITTFSRIIIVIGNLHFHNPKTLNAF